MRTPRELSDILDTMLFGEGGFLGEESEWLSVVDEWVHRNKNHNEVAADWAALSEVERIEEAVYQVAYWNSFDGE